MLIRRIYTVEAIDIGLITAFPTPGESLCAAAMEYIPSRVVLESLADLTLVLLPGRCARAGYNGCTSDPGTFKNCIQIMEHSARPGLFAHTDSLLLVCDYSEKAECGRVR